MKERQNKLHLNECQRPVLIGKMSVPVRMKHGTKTHIKPRFAFIPHTEDFVCFSLILHMFKSMLSSVDNSSTNNTTSMYTSINSWNKGYFQYANPVVYQEMYRGKIYVMYYVVMGFFICHMVVMRYRLHKKIVSMTPRTRKYFFANMTGNKT